MVETWANIVTNHIYYVGPPPGFTLLHRCLCNNCQGNNCQVSIHKTFVFDIKNKQQVTKRLEKYNIHFKIVSFSQKCKLELYICEKLWSEIKLL